MKVNIVLFIIGFMLFLACKKKGKYITTTIPPLTETELAQQKAHAKWRLINNQIVEYVGQTANVDSVYDYFANISDSIEFKSDNLAYLYINGISNTVQQAILSPTKMVFDLDTFTINTLTASDFVITFQNRNDSNYYDKVIILKK